jgi:hypothetical protein
MLMAATEAQGSEAFLACSLSLSWCFGSLAASVVVCDFDAFAIVERRNRDPQVLDRPGAFDASGGL